MHRGPTSLSLKGGGGSSAEGEGGGETYIDCEPLGDLIATDKDGNRFYEGVRVNELEIHRFDCVKVTLEVGRVSVFICCSH